jgi:hypothetical protein
MAKDFNKIGAEIGALVSEKNDGGSADYYQLPVGAVELQDLIEHKSMNFAVGNIFKASYRLDANNSLSNRARDLRKIIWFANRELERLTFQNIAGYGILGAAKDEQADHHQTAPPADEWADKDLCRRCWNKTCPCPGTNDQILSCISFMEAQ